MCFCAFFGGKYKLTYLLTYMTTFDKKKSVLMGDDVISQIRHCGLIEKKIGGPWLKLLILLHRMISNCQKFD